MAFSNWMPGLQIGFHCGQNFKHSIVLDQVFHCFHEPVIYKAVCSSNSHIPTDSAVVPSCSGSSPQCFAPRCWWCHARVSQIPWWRYSAGIFKSSESIRKFIIRAWSLGTSVQRFDSIAALTNSIPTEDNWQCIQYCRLAIPIRLMMVPCKICAGHVETRGVWHT